MRIGLIARADRTGLGNQTRDFFYAMGPDAVLVADCSRFGFPCEMERFEKPRGFVSDIQVWPIPHYYSDLNIPEGVIDRFLEKVDCVFACETPYNYYLFEAARKRGVKTVLQPNYEFLDYLHHPSLPKPDVMACPTSWHIDDIHLAVPGAEVIELPVPTSAEVPDRWHCPREEFVVRCLAGTVAEPDRAGVKSLLAAAHLLAPGIRVEILAQKDVGHPFHSNNVEIRETSFDTREELYDGMDVLVLPRRWGGNCLPAQEAARLGIPVVMPNVSPQNGWEPDVMHSVEIKSTEIMGLGAVQNLEVHTSNPESIADVLNGLHESQEIYERAALECSIWAAKRSWFVMKPKYEEVLSK